MTAAMGVIDSHQHYWDTARFDYRWTEQGLPGLDRDFVPAELEPQLVTAAVERTVAVQVLHDRAETMWLLELARAQSSIAGVVGWVDLVQDRDAIHRDLDALRAAPGLVGIRHLVHEEADPDWLVRSDVIDGLGVLEDRGVPFDLLLRPPHLPHVPRLSEALPELRMVIDHIAKPRISEHLIEPWARDLRTAALNPNVFCKVSGMVTEADHATWRPSDLAPYVEIALEAFGADRVMFGSDWPVCTLAAGYARVLEALREVLGARDEPFEARLFGATAIQFYGLQP
jgi:L-fuconolactonase